MRINDDNSRFSPRTMMIAAPILWAIAIALVWFLRIPERGFVIVAALAWMIVSLVIFRIGGSRLLYVVLVLGAGVALGMIAMTLAVHFYG